MEKATEPFSSSRYSLSSDEIDRLEFCDPLGVSLVRPESGKGLRTSRSQQSSLLEDAMVLFLERCRHSKVQDEKPLKQGQGPAPERTNYIRLARLHFQRWFATQMAGTSGFNGVVPFAASFEAPSCTGLFDLRPPAWLYVYDHNMLARHAAVVARNVLHRTLCYRRASCVLCKLRMSCIMGRWAMLRKLIVCADGDKSGWASVELSLEIFGI